jgi:hypothetical protein
MKNSRTMLNWMTRYYKLVPRKYDTHVTHTHTHRRTRARTCTRTTAHAHM